MTKEDNTPPEDFQLEPEGFGGCFKGLWRKH
jgi:hypothetical protein